MNDIIIIDCYNIGHIAFHGTGGLDYHGRRTGVVFGFLHKILTLAKLYQTGYFMFCWDSQKSLRKLKYPPYKERGEKKMVIRTTGEIIDYKAFHTQMEEIRNDVLPGLGFRNNYMANGYEADDIMAAIPNTFPVDPGIHYVLATTDRDLYQCLGDRVSIYNIRTKKPFTIVDFEDTYGISPSQWVVAKAMGGCDSDTIAGVTGVADPAKSPKSRALAFLKGNLSPNTAAYKAITSQAGQDIIKRNTPLIKLPFNSITVPQWVPDQLTRKTFVKIFDEMGFTSFFIKEVWNEWETYFKLYN